jgi:hypothetical protein
MEAPAKASRTVLMGRWRLSDNLKPVLKGRWRLVTNATASFEG